MGGAGVLLASVDGLLSATLKLEVGHLSEVAFGEDQKFQFDGNHSTKKSKSCVVVVSGDTDPRSFVDDGDVKQSGPVANFVDGCDFCDDNKGQKTCVWVEKSMSLWGVQQRRLCSSCCADSCLMIAIMREVILVVS